MAFVRFPVVGNITLKDYYRDKVFNGGFTTEFSVTPYSSRISVNEGKIVIDTTNRIGYVYLDVTMLVS